MNTFPMVTQWFRDQRIRRKIMIVFIPLILLPLIILGIVSNMIYSNSIIAKTKTGVGDNSSLIATRMDSIFVNAESCANMLTLNLNKVIEQNPLSPLGVSNLQRYTAITNQLSFALLVFPDVESALFVDTKHNAYGSHPSVENTLISGEGKKKWQEIMETNGMNVWLPMDRRVYLTSDPNSPVLTLSKKIWDINSGQPLGILFLNIQEKSLSSVYEDIATRLSGSYFISNQKGTVVSASNPAQILQPIADENLRKWVVEQDKAIDIRNIGNNELLLSVYPLPRLDWKLVSVIPLSSLTSDIQKVTYAVIVTGLICYLFALLGAGQLSKLITLPMIRLSKSMSRFNEGELDVQLDVQSNDEIGLFSSSFTRMRLRLKELLMNIKQEQKKKREYELALIQAQIKPHFLYNTLDVVYSLLEIGKVKEAQRVTKTLAEFYRAVLSKGKEIITIEEEIRNVHNYLKIQKLRYSDVFTYTIDIDKEILKAQILKLTIQPLVENAIYHGLKEKIGMGHLSVHGYKTGHVIYIQIIDDGVGMNDAVWQRILEGSLETEGESFGLRNVHDRLRLYFGESYGLKIKSEVGQGTTITIMLPTQTALEKDLE